MISDLVPSSAAVRRAGHCGDRSLVEQHEIPQLFLGCPLVAVEDFSGRGEGPARCSRWPIPVRPAARSPWHVWGGLSDGPHAWSPGTLRHARREARTAVLLARGGVVLQGKQATRSAASSAWIPSWFPGTPPSRFTESSTRSVRIAPAHRARPGHRGGGDGLLLRQREVASMCARRSSWWCSRRGGTANSGAVLAGEGVMGRARGFFQVGARTVAGSLGPWRRRGGPTHHARIRRQPRRGAERRGGAGPRAAPGLICFGSHLASGAVLVTLGDGDRAVVTPASAGRMPEHRRCGAAILLGSFPSLPVIRVRRILRSHRTAAEVVLPSFTY